MFILLLVYYYTRTVCAGLKIWQTDLWGNSADEWVCVTESLELWMVPTAAYPDQPCRYLVCWGLLVHEDPKKLGWASKFGKLLNICWRVKVVFVGGHLCDQEKERQWKSRGWEEMVDPGWQVQPEGKKLIHINKRFLNTAHTVCTHCFFLPSDARESMALVIAMSICRSAHQFSSRLNSLNQYWMYSHSIFPEDKPSSLSTLRLRLFVLRSNSTNNEWFATTFCTTVVSPWWSVMTLCRPWVSSSICLIPWLWTNQIENKCLHCTSLQTTDMLNHVVFLALVRFGRQNHHALVTTNSTNISFLSPQSELEIVQRSP